jgi:hypothetical protein
LEKSASRTGSTSDLKSRPDSGAAASTTTSIDAPPANLPSDNAERAITSEGSVVPPVDSEQENQTSTESSPAPIGDGVASATTPNTQDDSESNEVTNSSLKASTSLIENSMKEEEAELAEFGDEIEVIPVVARTLMSPLPSLSDILNQGMTFMNMSYDSDEFGAPMVPIMENDDDATTGGVASTKWVAEGGLGDALAFMSYKMERSGSMMEDIMGSDIRSLTSASKNGTRMSTAAILRTGMKTPHLRPSSPTQIEEELQKKKEMEEQALKRESLGSKENGADSEAVGESQVDEDPLQTMLEEGINREQYISNIKMALDTKDKFKSRNVFLQNKLGEYFKRKRVSNFYLIFY